MEETRNMEKLLEKQYQEQGDDKVKYIAKV
jgi:hypothetical protein